MRGINLHVTGKFELWVLVAVIAMCSIWVGAVTIYLLTDSNRRCHEINRTNEGNRQAWKFMESAVEEQWARHPPSVEERRITQAFFVHVQELLAPIKC